DWGRESSLGSRLRVESRVGQGRESSPKLGVRVRSQFKIKIKIGIKRQVLDGKLGPQLKSRVKSRIKVKSRALYRDQQSGVWS
ncbi:hypothetical protein HAX54_009699, partial [Datura stramonium]|nr:hypothetical protein [Datura stramonium]